jgi:hypothetical protein
MQMTCRGWWSRLALPDHRAGGRWNRSEVLRTETEQASAHPSGSDVPSLLSGGRGVFRFSRHRTKQSRASSQPRAIPRSSVADRPTETLPTSSVPQRGCALLNRMPLKPTLERITSSHHGHSEWARRSSIPASCAVGGDRRWARPERAAGGRGTRRRRAAGCRRRRGSNSAASKR